MSEAVLDRQRVIGLYVVLAAAVIAGLALVLAIAVENSPSPSRAVRAQEIQRIQL